MSEENEVPKIPDLSLAVCSFFPIEQRSFVNVLLLYSITGLLRYMVLLNNEMKPNDSYYRQ